MKLSKTLSTSLPRTTFALNPNDILRQFALDCKNYLFAGSNECTCKHFIFTIRNMQNKLYLSDFNYSAADQIVIQVTNILGYRFEKP